MKLDRTLIDKDGAPTVKETQDYFKKNDYTTAPLPFDSATGKDKDVIIYIKARELFKKVWLKNQKQLGGKASFVNFTKNYPIAVLESADEKLIAGAVTNILSEDELYKETIDSFFENMQPQIELAIDTYAQKNSKDVDDLTEKEIAFVIDKLVDLFLSEMMNAHMQSQSVPELIKTTKKIGTHEDFNHFIEENRSRKDFYRKWDHTRTKIGKIFSFSELADNEDAIVDMEANFVERHGVGYEEDEIADSETWFIKFESLYLSMLDDVEKQIYESRMKGRTTTVIAKELGYASHSTVVKKLKKMRKKFDEMCAKLNKQ